MIKSKALEVNLADYHVDVAGQREFSFSGPRLKRTFEAHWQQRSLGSFCNRQETELDFLHLSIERSCSFREHQNRFAFF